MTPATLPIPQQNPSSHHETEFPSGTGSPAALAGENGAGKTTHVKLLTGMYRPAAGPIQPGEVSPGEPGAESRRRRTTAAFQDFARFGLLTGDSAGAGGLPRTGDEQAIRTALGRAHGTGAPDSLPGGLGTPIGRSLTSGRDLPGGQWQKAAPGRAMMRTARSSSSPASRPPAWTHRPRLHCPNAASGRPSAARSAAVTLFVSHRFSTVRAADLIVVLHEGRVVEAGSHDDPIARGGRCAGLFELQARAYR